MVDATLSLICREHPVDKSFVVGEIKEYLNSHKLTTLNKGDLKILHYSPTKALGGEILGSLTRKIRLNFKKLA